MNAQHPTFNAQRSTAIGRSMEGAATTALSNEQKKRICMLARDAWEKAGRPGYADQPIVMWEDTRLTVSEAFDLWRHDEQRKAVGTEHLTCSGNRVYPYLMAHFARLAGNAGLADYWAGRTLGDPSRQAMSKLRSTFRDVKDVIENPEAYAAAICRAKYKCALADCAPNQVWALVYDLRRGAQKRRAKELVAVPF